MSPESSDTREPLRLRSFAKWAVLLVTTIGGLASLGLVLNVFYREYARYSTLVFDHVRAIVGIPIAATSAFCVLLVLEARGGPIEFQALGVHFRGASGPAVIWVFAFLAFAVVIRLLW